MDNKSKNIVIAALMIALGALFIAFKSDIIGIAMTLLGVALIASAILDLTKHLVVPCVVKAVIGVVVIIFGWVFISAALYIIAALLLIYGILRLYLTIKSKIIMDTKSKTLNYLHCILFIVIGLCLLFNQGGTISWVFILSGILLIINGILALLTFFTSDAA